MGRKTATFANFAAYFAEVRRTGVTRAQALAQWNADKRRSRKLAEDEDDEDDEDDDGKPFGGKKAKPFGKGKK